MFLDKEIEDLNDDGFEGSKVERCIFREIFFRNDTGSTSKKCLVTGVINFECESSKNTDTSFGSNSENSAITSHSSSKNTCLEELSNVTEAFRETSEPEYIPRQFASVKRNDEDVSGKQKFSDSDPCYVESDLGKFSPAFPGRNASNILYPATDPVSEVVTLRLVESSGQGVTSSCYLLKQHGEMVRGYTIGDPHVSNCRFLGLEGINGKEVSMGKAIASPVSQESFESRLFAASPTVNVHETSGSPLDAEERPQEYESFELDLSSVTLKTNLNKDPRPLLQYHVADLLRAAGWRIERRRRPSRQYMESVYRTPKGRAIREFPKAWRLCGELLSADKYGSVEEDDVKKWTNISQFLSDLSDTLVNLEVSNHSELSYQWRLLDPFVIVALIDRKIGALRKGEVVKAIQRLVIDKNSKWGDSLPLPNTDSNNHQIAKGDLPTSLCGSTLANESKMAVSAENFHDCFKQSGNGEYSGQKNSWPVKSLKGKPVYTAKEEGMRLGNASGETGNQCSEFSGDKTSSLDMTSFPTFGTGSTIVQSGSCSYDFSVTSRNCHNVVEQAVSLHQVDNTNCQISDRQSSEYNVKTIKEVNSFQDNGEFSGGRVTDVGHYLLRSGDDYRNSTKDGLVCFQDREVVRHSSHVEEGGRLHYESSEFNVVDLFSLGDVILKKKTHKKSKRISEIEPSSLYQSGNLGSTSVNMADLLRVNGNVIHLDLNQVEGDLVANARNKETQKKSSSFNSLHHQIEKKSPKLKKRNCCDYNDSKIMKKKLRCHIEDDDLLVSAIIKNKDFSPSTAKNASKKKSIKSKAWRKLKSQKRSCRLLPSLVNGGKHFKDGKWYSVGVRTVLSWLIGSGIISLNDVIQYRNPKDDAVIKDGLITRDGIFCKCCSKVLTISEFKTHAGFKLNRPCLNLFMESGKPFTLCQLQAWSTEYKTRKGGTPAVQVDKDDPNDDSCGLCGDGGELLCCDNCPSTFHQACLSTQDLPEGSWYCTNCTCWICGSLVNDKDTLSTSDALRCSQCEHKYHETCLKEKSRYQKALSDSSFCGTSCQEVYSGLQSRVGLINYVSEGFSWTLLKCIHEDQKVHSVQRFALKAECNSRLAVALTIMEECFLSMVDPRTGIDMIPHVLYNWGSDFARLNFQGFYTVVLEKDDVLISVASVRVHGTTVAEMPLIATCSKYRRQGMCRRLVTAIEEMLISLKVEKIVIAAIPDLVETWTEGFGYKPVENSEKLSLNKINLMVFPGTVLLKKPLYGNIQGQSGDASWSRAVESTKVEIFCNEFKQQSNENDCTSEAATELENDIVECKKLTRTERGGKMKAIDGTTGVYGVSLIETEESTEVGIQSTEAVLESEACDAVTESMDGKNFLVSEVCVEIDKKTAEQQSDADYDPSRIGAETATTLVQGKNLVELGVVGAESKSTESIKPSRRVCCWLEVGAESELGLNHMLGSEVGTNIEVVKAVEQQSNGSYYVNMQVGEDESSSLQDQFSKLSCEDPTPNLVTNIESLGMYDETQPSLDKQLQKPSGENVRLK